MCLRKGEGGGGGGGGGGRARGNEKKKERERRRDKLLTEATDVPVKDETVCLKGSP